MVFCDSMTCRQLSGVWRLVVTYVWPLVLLPLPIVWNTRESYCAYGVLIMAGYWLTEALPLPITGFLPLVIFPMMGVAGVKDLAKHYIKDTNLVFLGGLIMAVSLEHCGLHKRIGLTILRLTGTSPKRLLSGFMLGTWLLSMLISNTATAAMMIPVVHAILVQVTSSTPADNATKLCADREDNLELATMNLENRTSSLKSPVVVELVEDSENDNKEYVDSSVSILDSKMYRSAGTNGLEQSFCKMMCLSVAIACNIGGTATLTGSGTNLVLYEAVNDLYAEYNQTSPINFSTWLFYGMPSSILCLFVAWLWLQVLFLGFRETFTWQQKSTINSSDSRIATVVQQQYESLGKISFSEICNVVFLCLLLLLWLTRDPGFVPGWADLFPVKRFVTDSVPVFLLIIIMFTIPSQTLQWKSQSKIQYDALLNWCMVSTKVPWGPILTLGGGFAMAEACKVSGLNQLISNQLVAVKDASPTALLFLVVYMSVLLTQIAPNIPTTALTLPIIAVLAQHAGIAPLQLMFPANIAASYAFTLPVSTPPNAIVFSYGIITSLDMAKTGFVLSLICAFSVICGAVTWGPLVISMEILRAPVMAVQNHTMDPTMNMTNTDIF